jgi:tetratricopeptide (TPR) repeat protein
MADRKALASENPEDDADRRALAATRYQLGTLLARLKDRGAEDESAYRSAIAEQEGLIARPAARSEDRRELARYLNNLGILQSAADPDAAAESFRRALKIQDGLEAESANNSGFRWQRARTRNNLANLLARAGVVEEAGPLYDQARAGFEGLSTDFPSVPDYRRELGVMLNNLGLLRQAHPAENAAPADLFRKALDDQRKLAIEFPEIPDHRQKLAITCFHLGRLLRTSSPTEADGFLKEAVSLTSKLVAEHPQVPEYLANNGRVLIEEAMLRSDQGQRAVALERLDSAIRSLEQARQGNPREATTTTYLLEAHNDRAEVFLKLGRHADVAAEVARLAGVLPDRPEPHLAAAKFLVRCVELASADAALAGPKKAELGETYAQDAVKALRKAFEKGLDGGEKVLDDPAFTPLKGRADFEKLRENVKSGIKRAVV